MVCFWWKIAACVSSCVPGDTVVWNHCRSWWFIYSKNIFCVCGNMPRHILWLFSLCHLKFKVQLNNYYLFFWVAIRLKEYSTFFNPFLSVHIPYVQSEGILPQIRLLQWRAYIFRNTQCFSTKLGRNMVNALFCHKTLKYWWPLTYIQGHVIQDGRQIGAKYSLKSLFWAKKLLLLGQFFDKFDNFFFVLLLNTISIL